MVKKIRLAKRKIIEIAIATMAGQIPERTVFEKFDISAAQFTNIKGLVLKSCRKALKTLIKESELFIKIGQALDKLLYRAHQAGGLAIISLLDFSEKDIILGLQAIKPLPKEDNNFAYLCHRLTQNERLENFVRLFHAMARLYMYQEMKERGTALK